MATDYPSWLAGPRQSTGRAPSATRGAPSWLAGPRLSGGTSPTLAPVPGPYIRSAYKAPVVNDNLSPILSARQGRAATGEVPTMPDLIVDPNAGWNALVAAQAAAAKAAANRQAAEIAAAKAAGKSRSATENANTQQIIDTLLGTLKGYETGRDQQVKDAGEVFDQNMLGVDSQYSQSIADLQGTADINESDETAKTAAIRSNRAREQQSILENAISMGAGETDQLRAMVQAFENADSNQLEVTGAYYDSKNNVDSQVRQTNSNTENARRNVWGNKQDSLAMINNDFYANYSRIWTEAQRAGASNSNVASAYSTKFNAQYGGKNPVEEAAKYAGKVYDWQAPELGWAEGWGGKKTQLGQQFTTPTSAAAATRLGGLKRPEGANLRRA